MTIAARWAHTRADVAAACAAAGRSINDLTIVAVSKKHPASAVDEVVAAGATDVGENYAQELVAKREAVSAQVRWHFIGALQRNKVKLVVGNVALIHAVDSIELLREIDKRAAALQLVQPVLIVVNLAGEATKSGITDAELPAVLAAATSCANVAVNGLMTMPPPDADSRPFFAALRQLRDRHANPARPLPSLSMGMSDDFAAAIAEGATHVRIGTAIFGQRPPRVG